MVEILKDLNIANQAVKHPVSGGDQMVWLLSQLNLASYLCWNTQVGKWLVAMLAVKRLPGVTPEVNLRQQHKPPPSTNEAAQSGFETQRIHHKQSETVVSLAPQKGLMSSKFFFKKSQNPMLFLHRVQCRTWRLWITIHIHNKWKSESHGLPAPCTMQDVGTVDHYSHT